MKRKRFTEEQIISVLKEAEADRGVQELVRKHGISEGMFYRWKAKYGGMQVSDPRRRYEFEARNRKDDSLLGNTELYRAA